MCAIALASAIALHAQTPATVKDKVYTKEQAARGERLFTQSCAKCHLFTGPVTKDGPPLGGDVFLTKWDGKSVYELALGIKLTMPPDGSIVLDDTQTSDVVAFVLKSNGFAEGEKPLKTDTTARGLTIVKAK
jgi:mono/diheme cytochrome c family protein